MALPRATLPCHFSSEGGGQEEMSPYFPPGHGELAEWSGDCVIDNLAGLPRRPPDSPEERERLVLIAGGRTVVD